MSPPVRILRSHRFLVLPVPLLKSCNFLSYPLNCHPSSSSSEENLKVNSYLKGGHFVSAGPPGSFGGGGVHRLRGLGHRFRVKGRRERPASVRERSLEAADSLDQGEIQGSLALRRFSLSAETGTLLQSRAEPNSARVVRCCPWFRVLNCDCGVVAGNELRN